MKRLLFLLIALTAIASATMQADTPADQPQEQKLYAIAGTVFSVVPEGIYVSCRADLAGGEEGRLARGLKGDKVSGKVFLRGYPNKVNVLDAVIVDARRDETASPNPKIPAYVVAGNR